MNYWDEIILNWKAILKNKHFVAKLWLTLPVLVVGLYFLTKFLTYIEYRPGVLLNDPFLNLFESVNLSWFIFLFTYGSVAIGALFLLPNPKLVLTVLHAYMLILLCRVMCLYFVPLEPPSGIIPLHDIFMEGSFYSGRLNLKDLFFSGHTAAILLFFFAVPEKKQKWIMLILSVMVASGILLQHVHYTIDVILAPLFAWFCFRLSMLWNK